MHRSHGCTNQPGQVAAGAALLKPAHDTAWSGYVGYFADPDGHVWEVAWNPGFPLAEDGSVLVPE